MIDQENQSPEAQEEGVCHTSSECYQMFSELSPTLKAPALLAIYDAISPEDRDRMKVACAEDPENWMAPFHFWFGMSIRNLLRKNGFGEDYFGVHNLDDIYVYLLEEALKLSDGLHPNPLGKVDDVSEDGKVTGSQG